MTEPRNTQAALVGALVEFHRKVGNLAKGKKANAGKFAYGYMDLSTLLAETRPVLCDCGLAVTQMLTEAISADDPHDRLVTILWHKDGGSITSSVRIEHHKNPQEFGSELSYKRRYAYLALLSLMPADEDDDGAKAKDARRAQPQRNGGQARAKPKEPPPVVNRITTWAQERGMPWAQLQPIVQEATGREVERLGELKQDELEAVVNLMDRIDAEGQE